VLYALFLFNFNAVFKDKKCIWAASFGLGYLSIVLKVPRKSEVASQATPIASLGQPNKIQVTFT